MCACMFAAGKTSSYHTCSCIFTYKHTNTPRYYLQIDSHMRFAHHWDDFLISELRACPSDKPVISTYPPGYKGQGNSSTNCQSYTKAAPFTIIHAYTYIYTHIYVYISVCVHIHM